MKKIILISLVVLNIGCGEKSSTSDEGFGGGGSGRSDSDDSSSGGKAGVGGSDTGSGGTDNTGGVATGGVFGSGGNTNSGGTGGVIFVPTGCVTSPFHDQCDFIANSIGINPPYTQYTCTETSSENCSLQDGTSGRVLSEHNCPFKYIDKCYALTNTDSDTIFCCN